MDLAPLQRLLSIMARLRDRQAGCAWDLAQTFKTIAPYTIEEAYEVADAIDRDDMTALRDELGDLLLQVVFHARIAEEAETFSFADVAASVADKMETRHPHIFGEDDDHQIAQDDRWEALKEQERIRKGAVSALDGVAQALPALMRAEKLQKRAARAGFDWPDEHGPKAKLAEELDELAAAETLEERRMEAGDLLFAAVNIVRRYGVTPEESLRAANAKFERRFRDMERLALAEGKEFDRLTLGEQDGYWERAKAAERRQS